MIIKACINKICYGILNCATYLFCSIRSSLGCCCYKPSFYKKRCFKEVNEILQRKLNNIESTHIFYYNVMSAEEIILLESEFEFLNKFLCFINYLEECFNDKRYNEIKHLESLVDLHDPEEEIANLEEIKNLLGETKELLPVNFDTDILINEFKRIFLFFLELERNFKLRNMLLSWFLLSLGPLPNNITDKESTKSNNEDTLGNNSRRELNA
jgi:hypothetical protein